MTGFFSRKANDKAELIWNENHGYAEEWKIKVVHTVTLPHEEYEVFCDNLFEDQDFLEEITYKCGFKQDDDIAQCILVRDESLENEAIAVNTEGYRYARYAALIRL